MTNKERDRQDKTTKKCNKTNRTRQNDKKKKENLQYDTNKTTFKVITIVLCIIYNHIEIAILCQSWMYLKKLTVEIFFLTRKGGSLHGV